jgi:hypothetical protein
MRHMIGVNSTAAASRKTAVGYGTSAPGMFNAMDADDEEKVVPPAASGSTPAVAFPLRATLEASNQYALAEPSFPPSAHVHARSDSERRDKAHTQFAAGLTERLSASASRFGASVVAPTRGGLTHRVDDHIVDHVNRQQQEANDDLRVSIDM